MSGSLIFDILLLSFSAYYGAFVLRILRGLGQLPAVPSTAQPAVTVIIAARNEEAVVRRCLASVLAQDYPSDRLEVIVVDDASEDGTAARVAEDMAADRRVHLLTLPDREGLITGRKPEAIAMGVARAGGEIIITTDADCLHGRGWIRAMTASFASETALVAGPVTLDHAPGLFSAVERLDFLGLIISGAGLIGARRPIICNGANLAYRRSAYDQVRDRVQVSSNDDGTLMSRIVTRNVGEVTFALNPEAVVRTPGMRSIGRYFRQRMRWASVRGRFLDRSVYVELTALFLYFTLLLLCTLLLPLEPRLATSVIAAWAIKLTLDWVALQKGCRALHLDVSLPVFVLAQMFHPIGIVLSTLLSLVIPFRWKGRRFNR